MRKLTLSSWSGVRPIVIAFLASLLSHAHGSTCLAEKTKPLFTLKGHTDSVRSVAFSPDGKLLASASQNGTVTVWDAATGKKTLAFKGHKADSPVWSVAFSPDGKWAASASYDQTVKTVESGDREGVTHAETPRSRLLHGGQPEWKAIGFRKSRQEGPRVGHGHGEEVVHAPGPRHRSRQRGIQPRWQATRLGRQ